MATIRDLATELTQPAPDDKIVVSDTSAAAGSEDKWMALSRLGVGTTITVEDDAVGTVIAPISGFVFVTSRGSGLVNGSYAAAYYASGSRWAEPFLQGSDVDDSVAVLTGTTGTNGKITISVSNVSGTPLVYVENRMGAQRIFNVITLGA